MYNFFVYLFLFVYLLICSFLAFVIYGLTYLLPFSFLIYQTLSTSGSARFSYLTYFSFHLFHVHTVTYSFL